MIKLWNKIIQVLGKNSSCRTALLISAFMILFIVFHHTMRIKKLENDLIVLKENMSKICEAGLQTTKGLENNQNGLIEAFYEIYKLKQAQKEMTYH